MIEDRLQKLDEQLRELIDATQDVDLHVRPFECEVCFERYKNIVLLPCGHVSMCDHCWRRMECDRTGRRGLCPVCMSDVDAVTYVYGGAP